MNQYVLSFLKVLSIVIILSSDYTYQAEHSFGGTQSDSLETLDNTKPSVEQTMEFLPLSPTYICHLDERDEQDTQVFVVSSAIRNAIVVVYAGTDDLRNVLTDGDILMETFGPSNTSKYFHTLNENIRVHAGFNHAVFSNGLFDRIVETLNKYEALFVHRVVFTPQDIRWVLQIQS